MTTMQFLLYSFGAAEDQRRVGENALLLPPAARAWTRFKRPHAKAVYSISYFSACEKHSGVVYKEVPQSPESAVFLSLLPFLHRTTL